MTGGSGDDTYIVDNTLDVVTEHFNEGIDTVQSSVNYVLSNNVERLILTGVSNNNATGNDLNNTIFGNGGNNVLDGKLGADTMWGGDGDDTYYVDDAADLIAEVSATGGIDTVISSVSRSLLNPYLENLTLVGSARAGVGNGLDNILLGGNINNDLYGGDGNDHLIGGGGKDYLVGGAGADVFVYGSATDSTFSPSGRDLIGDFEDGVDVVDLSAINVPGPTGGFHFVGNGAIFTGTIGELIAQQAGSSTLVHGDVNGDGVVDLSIEFKGLHVFSTTDFVL
jgi:serralysin